MPISRQIDAQIRAQILAGSLRAEDQLPSVRGLARELAVNVNTVFRVYERLAADGLIELRHGDGTYVAPRRKGAGTAQLARRRREFATGARRAGSAGVDAGRCRRGVAAAGWPNRWSACSQRLLFADPLPHDTEAPS